MTKPVHSKTTPANTGFYTISYQENGKTHTIKAEKGIEVFGSHIKLGKTGAPATNFDVKGQKNVTLPKNTPQTLIDMLKTFAKADNKPELTSNDVATMFHKSKLGELPHYLNSNLKEGAKIQTGGLYYNTPKHMDVDVADKKDNQSYGLRVQSPGHEKMEYVL